MNRTRRARRRFRIGEREIVDGELVSIDPLESDAATLKIDHGVVAVLAAVIHERAEIADLSLGKVDRIAFAYLEILD